LGQDVPILVQTLQAVGRDLGLGQQDADLLDDPLEELLVGDRFDERATNAEVDVPEEGLTGVEAQGCGLLE